MTLRARIHRGAAEIGGNCVELEAAGRRILLDLGRPLWAEPDEELPLPEVRGLDGSGDSSLLGICLSHPHMDHYGLIDRVPEDVPIYMGRAAHRILTEASFFGVSGISRPLTGELRDRSPLSLGPFQITPFLADHSAFDAYSLLIEAEGRRLFYTGDYRGHGRKAALFERLLRDHPEPVDVLLTEGTQIRSVEMPPPRPRTETELEDELVTAFRETRGMVLACFSGQNVDRFVTMYRAALRADRDFIADLYAISIARATGLPSIPQPGHRRLHVYVPDRQRVQVKHSEEFHRVEEIRRIRVFHEDLARNPERYVLTFRQSMTRELERADCLGRAGLIWSLWDGYLEEESGERLLTFLNKHGIPLRRLHSSGHAGLDDIRRLVDAMSPTRVVPIHTEAPSRFPELFENVETHSDSEWWNV